MTLTGLTLEQSIEGVNRREFTVFEVLEAQLKALAEFGPRLNAVARIEADAAREQLDALEKSGDQPKGPLYGAVMAHKDLYERKGWVIEAGSRHLQGRVARHTATAIARLDAAGAIDCARLNTVEYALGTTGHNAITGPVHNPWNPDHITGGSSSGSAAMIAAGVIPASLGSDTGGSIRLPASACGLVGIKPTFGLVARSGVVALSESLDTVGPLARTVRDAARILQVIAGPDPDDPWSVDVPPPDYLKTVEDGIAGVRIGLPDSIFFDGIAPEVEANLDVARDILQELGAEFQSVHLDGAEHANAYTILLLTVEAAALHSKTLRTRAADYGPQTLSRMIAGLFTSGEAYVRTQKYRKQLAKRLIDNAFSNVDLLFAPVWPYPIPTIAETDLGDNPNAVEMVAASGQCTRPVNFLGFPSIAVPCGITPNGLPASFQLIARPFEEELLFRAARAFEREGMMEAMRPAVSVWTSTA